MRQAQITGPGRLRVAEVPPPRLPPGWALLRVVACGLCGTDAHLLDGTLRPPGASYPIVPGHEVAAVVTALAPPSNRGTSGDAVGLPRAPQAADATAVSVPAADKPRLVTVPSRGEVTVGDLVVPHLLRPCGACAACRSGHEQRCADAPVLGIQSPGGLADQVTWPVDRLVTVTGLDPVCAAVLADAGATAYHAVRTAAVPPGGVLVVIGAGGLGTHVLRLVRVLDPSMRLVAVVRSAATAERLAALRIPVLTGLAGAATRVTGEIGWADAVIDVSGAAEAPREAVRMLRAGGRLVLGSVVDGELRIGRIPPFVSREITVTGVYCSTMDDLRSVVALARDGVLDLTGSVTHVLPLHRVADAFALLRRRPPGMVRAVVCPDG